SGPATRAPSSPASVDSHHRAFSFSSIRSRPWGSVSNAERNSPLDRANSLRAKARRLSLQRPSSSSSRLDPPTRRGSTISDDRGRVSLATSRSLNSAHASLASSIDWDAQPVEGSGPLEPDTVLLKTKTAYLVVTRDYLVKMKSRADALALFPALATEGESPATISPHQPEPLVVIPISAIVSVLPAESTRPSFGFEVWWRSPLCTPLFCRSDFFFGTLADRNAHMQHIIRAMRASHHDGGGAAGHPQDIEVLLSRIHDEAEEPNPHRRKPDIFPVVPRGSTRKQYMAKLEDATKKLQESPAFYLVIGTYLCHLVEVARSKGGEPVCRHRSYGLVTLERFNAEWTVHEERFNITFRDPFKPPVTLELASRYYRQIVRAFGMADRFLKPAWPQLWQTMEIFLVSGLNEPQYLVPKEDFGCFKRTLDAYLAAYRCEAVDWEINWKTRFAPEFRLLPSKRGKYAPLQILAVLRALRYNDYFNSLSFRDVDLSVLHGLEDNNTPGNGNVAYLNRACVALGPGEIEMLKARPLLHQEFHALAFCAQTIRQIDFRNCCKSLPSPPSRLSSQHGTRPPSLQFLAPILNLLKSGITKCNWLILSGNVLPQADIDDLAETIKMGVIEGLDVSNCGLDDANLRDMILLPLSERRLRLHALSISGNPGRLPAHVLPGLLQCLPEIRELHLTDSIRAESSFVGSVLPFATLELMERLVEVDISGYKIGDATFKDIERFLHYRSCRLAHAQPLRFRKLVLNNCGITGTQAARLFHAIGENYGLHLCLSGNPIEDGISDLAAAIRQSHGPAGLHLELIEFREEANYLSLIRALTETRHLSFLSLAGTAPSPPPHGACSDELVATLHDLFARNASIRYLDLSGFSGRLDDGQLARGFGRALAGLAGNTTLTHLRVRSQRLHGDAGALGRALAANAALLALDCRDNGLNLTSLRFLAASLRQNRSLLACPFPPPERDAVWRTVLRGLQRTPSSSSSSSSAAAALSAPPGSVSATAAATAAAAAADPAAPLDRGRRDTLRREEERLLREELERQFAAIEARLAENR
ncbi:uncharacterized protein THITE_2030403, partial [Thermothielavioides terrestris NRRL 8126]